jgi:hypothetical protein
MFNKQKSKSAGTITITQINYTKLQIGSKTEYKQILDQEAIRLFNWGHSFPDYLRGGLNISVVTCIDYTSSNGSKTDSSGLHYLGGPPNQYQQAIRSVCSILLKYDENRSIELYGFGGVPRGAGGTSHFFPLTGDENNTAGIGLEGVEQIYRERTKDVIFSGGTKFSDSIAGVKKIVKKNFEKSPYNYSIMLILSDGYIDDMEETKEELRSAAEELPLSVIIVGVGRASFGNMKELDGDGEKFAERDIVQFVPFREVVRNGDEALAEKVLKEIPRQVVSFYCMKGIKPGEMVV